MSIITHWYCIYVDSTSMNAAETSSKERDHDNIVSTDDPPTTTTVQQASTISMTTTEVQSGDICKHVVS